MAERFSVAFTGSKLEGNRLSGLVHAFGTTTRRNGEVWAFAPGSFSKILKSPVSDTVAAWNHNLDMPLGRQSNNTLQLEETEAGLQFSCDLPDTTYANDLKVLIDRGDVNGMSFTADIGKGTVSKGPNGEIRRTFTDVRDLQDISPVTVPAFTGTVLNKFSHGFKDESIKSQTTRARARARFGE